MKIVKQQVERGGRNRVATRTWEDVGGEVWGQGMDHVWDQVMVRIDRPLLIPTWVKLKQTK